MDVGSVMSFGSLGFTLLLAGAVVVGPLVLLALVIFSFVRDKK